MVEEFFNKIDSISSQLMTEISNMDIMNFIIIALLFYVPFVASRKVASRFLRLMFFSIGVYMLYKSDDPRVLYDVKMLVGLGLVLPQISFIYFLIKDIFYTIKMMMANTYYFFLTIYYKILRFFKWIGELFFFIKMIFGKGKDEDSSSRAYNSNSNNHSESYTKEDYSYRKNRSYDSNDNDFFSEDDNYKDFNYDDYANSNNSSSASYEKIEEKEVLDELKQFYSPSAYIVLGVSSNADFKTIKKAYRVLIALYHPDRNLDQIELYTEISQNINEAYDKLKKIHS